MNQFTRAAAAAIRVRHFAKRARSTIGAFAGTILGVGQQTGGTNGGILADTFAPLSLQEAWWTGGGTAAAAVLGIDEGLARWAAGTFAAAGSEVGDQRWAANGGSIRVGGATTTITVVVVDDDRASWAAVGVTLAAAFVGARELGKLTVEVVSITLTRAGGVVKVDVAQEGAGRRRDHTGGADQLGITHTLLAVESGA